VAVRRSTATIEATRLSVMAEHHDIEMAASGVASPPMNRDVENEGIWAHAAHDTGKLITRPLFVILDLLVAFAIPWTFDVRPGIRVGIGAGILLGLIPLVFLFYLARAPIVQRNEARKQRDHARTQRNEALARWNSPNEVNQRAFARLIAKVAEGEQTYYWVGKVRVAKVEDLRAWNASAIALLQELVPKAISEFEASSHPIPDKPGPSEGEQAALATIIEHRARALRRIALRYFP
jgi:hypothetical protein